jgi:hypothetical protein
VVSTDMAMAPMKLPWARLSTLSWLSATNVPARPNTGERSAAWPVRAAAVARRRRARRQASCCSTKPIERAGAHQRGGGGIEFAIGQAARIGADHPVAADQRHFVGQFGAHRIGIERRAQQRATARSAVQLSRQPQRSTVPSSVPPTTITAD